MPGLGDKLLPTEPWLAPFCIIFNAWWFCYVTKTLCTLFTLSRMLSPTGVHLCMALRNPLLHFHFSLQPAFPTPSVYWGVVLASPGFFCQVSTVHSVFESLPFPFALAVELLRVQTAVSEFPGELLPGRFLGLPYTEGQDLHGDWAGCVRWLCWRLHCELE